MGPATDNRIDPRDLKIGQLLRTRRKARRMTLDDVAAASGVSIGQLSMIERGLASPSVKDLREICHALGMPVSWLFDPDDSEAGPEAGIVVRRNRRKHFELGAKKMHKELLTPDLTGALQVLSIVMEAGGSSGPECYSHDGEEAGLVLAGAMELVVGAETFVLEAGDSFRFVSTTPHRFANARGEPCHVLWITTPPFY